ncbi:AAA family ATPase [Anoxybacter fermentans]|uniref:AAA family ATPase n=1 Tax=Anoxybacter fermentans TaxID=1323375 RepID=A0A3Q9HTA0_9FIRM|nr:AAA family ATPase [Anoxybacter fermentans]
MLKLPYGISDFEVIRKEGYLYVDKTKYIEQLEEIGRYLFFIRPRRFGKSLFLSTLEHYYDINRGSQFERLFGGLYIGKNPTDLRNKFAVLKLNFSGLKTDSKGNVEESFRKTVLSGLIQFVESYYRFFNHPEEIIYRLEKETDLKHMLEIVYNAVRKIDKKIYLIIDEYDHFANDIIAMGDEIYYQNIVRASVFVRDFYETIKIGTQGVIDRIFITGISPIMLDDLTSGFNIILNITMDPVTNEMLGFTEEEVEEIIKQIKISEDVLDHKRLKKLLEEYYNGYLFNEDCSKRVYNPDMIFYYFDQWLRHKKPPKVLIADNVKTDYGRLNRLVKNKANREIMENIIKNEKITADIVSKFSFDRMYDQKYFVSLLFYLGLLTIDQKIRTRLLLKIPNFVIKTVFWEYFEQKLTEEYKLVLKEEELKTAIEAMAYDGEIKPYIEFISKNVLKVLSNRDLMKFDEKYLKVILISFLIQSNIYKPISEREVENGYIDIFLEKDIGFVDVKYEWLWELKYIKRREKDQLERIREEGLAQLREYADSNVFRDKKNLKKALIIFIGKGEYEIVNL